MTDKAREISYAAYNEIATTCLTLFRGPKLQAGLSADAQDIIIKALNEHAATIRAECADVARELQRGYEKHPGIHEYKHAGIAARRIATAIESMGESKAMERDDG